MMQLHQYTYQTTIQIGTIEGMNPTNCPNGDDAECVAI